MNSAEYTEVVEREGTRLLDVAAKALDAPVAACPGWDVARLVGHVGQVHGWMAQTVAAPDLSRPSHSPPEIDATDVIEWGREQLSKVVAALGTVVEGTPSWTFGSESVIDFFPRRMAHETVVHRYDVEHAAGMVGPIDSDLAADGVDELLSVGMVRSMNPAKEFKYPEGSLHLHRTDGEGEWLLVPSADGLVVTREHAKGDVAVRAAARDLLLYLWGRGADNLDIFGDQDLAKAWSEVSP